MTPIRLRVFNIASHQHVTRVSVALDTSDTETSVQYFDFFNRNPQALMDLVVNEDELNKLVGQAGKFDVRTILESKM